MSSHPERPVVSIALVTILGVVVPLLTLADAPGGPDKPRLVVHDRTGKLSFIGIDAHRGDFPGVAGDVLTNIAPEGGLEAIATYAAEFGLADPTTELQFVETRGGGRGRPTSLHYQQVHQGVPVVGGELVVSYDAAGRLAAITGEISPDVSVSTAPGISQIEAVELVWRMEVESTGREPVRFLVLVNAEHGGIGVAFNQIDMSWSGRVEPGSETSISGSVGRPTSTATTTVEPLSPTPNIFTYDSHDSDARQGGR